MTYFKIPSATVYIFISKSIKILSFVRCSRDMRVPTA